MKISDLLKLSTDNLRRRKGRTNRADYCHSSDAGKKRGIYKALAER